MSIWSRNYTRGKERMIFPQNWHWNVNVFRQKWTIDFYTIISALLTFGGLKMRLSPPVLSGAETGLIDKKENPKWKIILWSFTFILSHSWLHFSPTVMYYLLKMIMFPQYGNFNITMILLGCQDKWHQWQHTQMLHEVGNHHEAHWQPSQTSDSFLSLWTQSNQWCGASWSVCEKTLSS